MHGKGESYGGATLPKHIPAWVLTRHEKEYSIKKAIVRNFQAYTVRTKNDGVTCLNYWKLFIKMSGYQWKYGSHFSTYSAFEYKCSSLTLVLAFCKGSCESPPKKCSSFLTLHICEKNSKIFYEKSMSETWKNPCTHFVEFTGFIVCKKIVGKKKNYWSRKNSMSIFVFKNFLFQKNLGLKNFWSKKLV